MGSLVVREALDSDAATIAGIYNHYVLTSTVTFDTEPKSVEDRVAWLAHHGARYPVLVAEIDGAVVGWGSLSPWHERPAYDGSVEVSAYISPDSVGHGVGSELMRHLIMHAEELGYHALISQIVAGNEASMALGKRYGFSTVGCLPQVGRKFGEWLDVVLMIRVLE